MLISFSSLLPSDITDCAVSMDNKNQQIQTNRRRNTGDDIPEEFGLDFVCLPINVDKEEDLFSEPELSQQRARFFSLL